MQSSINRRIEVSLVIPTYNERANIESLIPLIRAVLEETGRSFEVIIVDDDSPDGTWQVGQELMREYPELRVLRRLHERGLARAVLRGWQEAQGEILAVIDGDLQHPPETLALLIEALEKQGGYRGSESACARWWSKRVEDLAARDLVGGHPGCLVAAPWHPGSGA